MKLNLKFVIVALALSAFTSITTEASVSLKKNVLVNTHEVKADSLIHKDSSSALREKLATIKLGVISEPLGTLTLDQSSLKKKLVSVLNEVNIPDSVTIKRTGAIIKASEIIDRLYEACHTDELKEDTLNIDVSKIPASMVLPGNLISYTLETSAQNNLGMKLFTLKGETDGGPFRYMIQINVTKVVETAKLTRLAKAGEIITEDMVIKENLDIKSDKSNVPVKYDEVVGRTLGKFKSAGTIIRETDLSSTIAPVIRPSIVAALPAECTVKAGDLVEYSVKSAGLSLRIPAKATQSGSCGDEITLINLQNKKVIRGVITKEGMVEYAKK